MPIYEAKVSMAFFNAFEIDGVTYRLHDHISPDVIEVENEDNGEIEELHIDEISNRIEQAEEATLVEQ